MFGFFKYLVLLPDPHRRKLFVASRIPERLRSREVLLPRRVSSASQLPSFLAWVIGFIFVLLCYQLAFLIPSVWIGLSVAVAGTLLLVAWLRYTSNLHGFWRSKNLRYVFYAERLNLRDLKTRRAILALDQNKNSQSLRINPVQSRGKRFLNLAWAIPVTLLAFGGLLALFLFLLLGGVEGTRAYLLLLGSLAGMVAAVAYPLYLIVISIRFTCECEAVPADSPLRAIVSEAYELYPDYNPRK